jgi:hypothetical protein
MLMNWDQIEDKWTAMTRRIRADLTDRPDRISTPRHSIRATMPVSGASLVRRPSDVVADTGDMPTTP